MEEIVFSIIIPVYNVERYLEECLESILNQSFQNYEVICVDDGSTDSSCEILKKYEQRESKIHVIYQKSNGVSMARNKGIDCAMGTYICFVDSDDKIDKNYLNKLYQCISQEKWDMICFNVDVFSKGETVKKIYHRKVKYFDRKQDYSKFVSGPELFDAMMRNNEFCIAVCLLVVKKDWLKEKKIWFEKGVVHEDNLFCLQCFLNATKACYLKDKLYLYRIREDSIVTSKKSCYILYSLVVNLCKVLKLCQTAPEELREQVYHYAEDIVLTIKNVNRSIDKEEKMEYQVDDREIDFLFRCMSIGKYSYEEYNPDNCKQGFEWQLQKAETIVLYGAGQVGKKVLSYLKMHNQAHKIVSFAVSNTSEKQEYIEGLLVKSIEDISSEYDEKKPLVILSVGINLQSELENICKKNGLTNVLRLDYTLLNYISMELEKSR